MPWVLGVTCVMVINFTVKHICSFGTNVDGMVEKEIELLQVIQGCKKILME